MGSISESNLGFLGVKSRSWRSDNLPRCQPPLEPRLTCGVSELHPRGRSQSVQGAGTGCPAGGAFQTDPTEEPYWVSARPEMFLFDARKTDKANRRFLEGTMPWQAPRLCRCGAVSCGGPAARAGAVRYLQGRWSTAGEPWAAFPV